ncbi:hypothetical protein BDQ17DRAFT_1435295 [Cyathus striatus]|nr:hypothetical protein BDQ17DRAFT_1435295 [Cyathus striatus]
MSFFFPPEIEDEIFRWVIFMHPYERTDAHLPEVCKRVKRSVEPLLYKTLKICGNYVHYTFKRGFHMIDEDNFAVALQSKPKSFFEMNVMHLMITDSVSEPVVSHLLSLCTGVQHLAYWSNYNNASVCNDIMTMPLQSLEVYFHTLEALSRLNRAHPQVTYLDVDSFLEDEAFSGLGWLPALCDIEINIGKRYDIRLFRKKLKIIKDTVPGLRSLIIRPIERYLEWRDERDFYVQIKEWKALDSIIRVADTNYHFVYLWVERMKNGLYRYSYTRFL